MVSKFLGKVGWRRSLAIVLGLTIVIVLLFAQLTGDSGVDSRAGEPTATTILPRSSVTDPYDNNPAPPSPTVDAAAAATAIAFARAWVNHPAGITRAMWWASVSKHSDAALAKALRVADPQTIPAKKVTGSPNVEFATPDSADFSVSTDSGVLRVSCVRQAGQWKVSSLDFTRADMAND